MVYIIFILLAAVLGEAAALMAGMIWKMWKKDFGGSGGGDMGRAREQETEEEFEKRWREGMSAMMGYDLSAARKAVRADGDEER